MTGTLKKKIVFKMKSGHVIDFEKVDIYPTEKYLTEVIKFTTKS
jgi:hypothetical protein